MTKTSHHGTGKVVTRSGESTRVDYRFSIQAGQLTGYLWATSGSIPTRKEALTLHLKGSHQYIGIYAEREHFEVENAQYRYKISLAKEQPDGDGNLLNA